MSCVSILCGRLARTLWCVGAGLLLFPVATGAFGLKTHIWIGQRLLDEVQASCRVDVASIPVSINIQTCESVRAHPGAFLSGVLGPDVYPDLISGQVTTHPGIAGDWQTSHWLSHIYGKAAPGRDLSFAAGYLVHAASDIFAHTYVNAYAGDIFVLTDERAVELRHFVLEKYIDSRLPSYKHEPGRLDPPTEFLRDKLIHHSDAARLSAKSSVALHVAAMYGVYNSVGQLADDLDRLERDAGKLLAEIVVTIAETEIKLATGEAQLKTAREVLRGKETTLEIQKELYEATNARLQKALDDLKVNKERINVKGIEARAARDAADAAKRIGADATAEAANLANRLSDLRTQLTNTRATVARRECRTVTDRVCSMHCPGGNWNPICREICRNVNREVCNVVNVASDAFIALTNRVNGVQQDLNSAQARAAQAAIDVAAHLAKEQAALQEQASSAALTAGLDAAKAAAQSAHDIEQARLKTELDATTRTRQEADRLAAEVGKLREKVLDSKAVKEALTEVVARSNILSGYARNWVHGMRVAGAKFISASHRVGLGMLENESSFVSSYVDWWKCEGQAYAAVPIQIGQARCAIEDFRARLESEVNKIVEKTLPPPFDDVFRRYLKIKSDIQGVVRKAGEDAGRELLKLAAPDRTTRDFIDVLAQPENATEGKLNSVFSSTGDAAGKSLLVFDRVSTLINADLALNRGQLDPSRFAALRNGLVLSKLALMDTQAIRGLVWVLGGDPSLIRESPDSESRSSVLFEMVRSIDGNHQWQPFGLPYPRTKGGAVPADAWKRNYGYGPQQERPGFQLFVNPALRETVFNRLFVGPMSGSLAQHPGLHGYPFPECEVNPFPVAFRSDGKPETSDISQRWKAGNE